LHRFCDPYNRCRQHIAAPVQTMPDNWRQSGERRRYLPADLVELAL